jgi:hypothetical protein
MDVPPEHCLWAQPADQAAGLQHAWLLILLRHCHSCIHASETLHILFPAASSYPLLLHLRRSFVRKIVSYVRRKYALAPQLRITDAAQADIIDFYIELRSNSGDMCVGFDLTRKARVFAMQALNRDSHYRLLDRGLHTKRRGSIVAGLGN